MPRLSLWVPSTPAPQGSKNCHCKGGRAVMFEQTAKHLKPFRKAVTAAARAAAPTVAVAPLDGPLVLELSFVLQRPANSKYADFPAGPPDLSKLVRAVEDALTDAEVWADDARVCALVARKFWTGSNGVPPEPGVLIAVAPLAPPG